MKLVLVLGLLLGLLLALAVPAVAAEPVLDLYDVRDLVKAGEVTAEQVADALREGRPREEAIIEVMPGGSLLVRAAPAVHEQIRSALTEFRSRAKGGLSVQVRILREEGEETGPAVRLLDPEEVRRILGGAAEAKPEALVSPRIQVVDGERANLSILTPVSYIADFEVEVGQDQFIADPIVETIHEGLILDFRAERQGENVRIELSFTMATLLRPMETFTTDLGGKQPVQIQLPEIHVLKKLMTLRLPLGATARIGGFTSPGEASGGTRSTVLLTVTRVEKAPLFPLAGEEINLVPDK